MKYLSLKNYRITISMLFLICIPFHLSAEALSLQFADRLCKAWNESSLVSNLTSENLGGSGWIDVVTGVAEVKEGTQIIASGRYECAESPEYLIFVEKKDNKVVCTRSGLYEGQSTWQFLPKTEEYKEFAEKFGLGAFYALWNNGMKGNKVTAWNNSKYFQTFFKIASNVGGDYLKLGCQK